MFCSLPFTISLLDWPYSPTPFLSLASLDLMPGFWWQPLCWPSWPRMALPYTSQLLPKGTPVPTPSHIVFINIIPLIFLKYSHSPVKSSMMNISSIKANKFPFLSLRIYYNLVLYFLLYITFQAHFSLTPFMHNVRSNSQNFTCTPLTWDVLHLSSHL
jgi:hypothetical protein